MVQTFMATTRGIVGRYGGRVVKFPGDGALAEFLGNSPDTGRRRAARALAVGDTATVRRILEPDTLLFNRPTLEALVGNREGLITALEDALDGNHYGGPFGPPDLLWDPTYDPYRDDPRFQELVRSRSLEPR